MTSKDHRRTRRSPARSSQFSHVASLRFVRFRTDGSRKVPPRRAVCGHGSGLSTRSDFLIASPTRLVRPAPRPFLKGTHAPFGEQWATYRGRRLQFAASLARADEKLARGRAWTRCLIGSDRATSTIEKYTGCGVRFVHWLAQTRPDLDPVPP
jgi:hypothetical protein